MYTHQHQQSESKKYKSKDPSDVLRREQNTLMRRIEKEQAERMAAMKKSPAYDPYRDVGRAPAQVPGSIAGPRMPGYEVFGKGYIKKRDEALIPGLTRSQFIKERVSEVLGTGSVGSESDGSE